jgi:hypothetical protein
MTSADTPAGDAELHLDDLYTWHYTPTSIGERYEMRWQAGPCHDCVGVVVREGPYYDAYIEVRDGDQTKVQWAATQFRTAGDARAWVQNHMIA